MSIETLNNGESMGLIREKINNNFAQCVTAVTDEVTGGIGKVYAGTDATAVMLLLQKLGRVPLVASIIGNSIAAASPGFFSRVVGESRGLFIPHENKGVGGDKTINMLNRINTVVPPTQVCFVLEGTNDADAIGSHRSMTVEDHAANMRGIIENLLGRGILPVIIMGCPRVNTFVSAQAIRNVDLYLAIQYGIPAFDPFSVLIDPATGSFKAGTSSDNVHPNQAGHALAVAEFYRQLSSSEQGTYSPKSNTSPGIFRTPLMLVDSNSDGMADNLGRSGPGMTTTMQDGDEGMLGKWQTGSATSGFNYIWSEVRDLPVASTGSEDDRIIVMVTGKFTNGGGAKHRGYVTYYALNGSTVLGSTSLIPDTTLSFETSRFCISAIPPAGTAKIRYIHQLDAAVSGVGYTAEASFSELQSYRLASIPTQAGWPGITI